MRVSKTLADAMCGGGERPHMDALGAMALSRAARAWRDAEGPVKPGVLFRPVFERLAKCGLVQACKREDGFWITRRGLETEARGDGMIQPPEERHAEPDSLTGRCCRRTACR